jgi:sialate O-acetylesterase
MNGKSLLLWIGWMWLAAAAVEGDIKLPRIFSDHMVLQRGEQINLWGTADANERLTIRLGDQTSECTADAAGNWTARIKPPVGSGPFELEISGGKTRVVFEGVLIGEVWLCAGQINMHQTLGQLSAPPATELGKGALRVFQVRELSVDHPQADFSDVAGWQEYSGEAIPSFSAVAVLFGREIADVMNVPVGLICATTVDGNCESWVPWSALAATQQVDSLLQDWTANEADRLNKNRPGNLFNGMIRPLVPFSLRGVVWYQGESDVGRADLYQHCFPTLISAWREQFQQPRMPFYFAQTAPFRYPEQSPEDLPRLWEIQRRALELPEVGMAPTVDLPPAAELNQVDKQVVASRLAGLALVRCYGREGSSVAPPTYASMRIEADKVRLSFDHAAGLHRRDGPGDGAEALFEIAGENREFLPAVAELSSQEIIVRSDKVDHPVAVRYGWRDTAQSRWLNGEQMPLLPFQAEIAHAESTTSVDDLE